MSRLKIVTFNIRCLWDGDGENSFIYRAEHIFDKINREKPDIVAFQEVKERSLERLRSGLGDYSFYGSGREKNYNDEGLYTAVRNNTISLLGMEIFWLSDDIYTPATRFEDQSIYPRICVQTLLHHQRSGKLIRVYNVHLDHKGMRARELGMECVLGKVRENAKKQAAETVILGDFNERPDGAAVKLCEGEKLVPVYDVTRDTGGTFHDFGRLKRPEKIDYIFMSPALERGTKQVKLWKDTNRGIFLSDHYPVCAVLDI